MKDVRLFGPSWSAYVRIARLVLIEKAVDYELIDVDFSQGKMPAEYSAWWGRMKNRPSVRNTEPDLSVFEREA